MPLEITREGGGPAIWVVSGDSRCCYTPAREVIPMRRPSTDGPSGFCVISLDQAWFCESCRAICNNPTCACCASAEHTERLAPWLDREREPISIPSTGVFLSVTPPARKGPQKVKGLPPQQVPRAS